MDTKELSEEILKTIDKYRKEHKGVKVIDMVTAIEATKLTLTLVAFQEFQTPTKEGMK